MKIRYAKAISIATCEHGSVFVRLHDENGEIFAVGVCDAPTAVELYEQLGDCAEEAVNKYALSNEPCAGHG